MLDGSPRILIVRPSALGDVARTVPLLASLRRAFPEARIDWMVNAGFADAVAHHPDLDQVVEFPRDRLTRFGLSVPATREGFALRRRLRQVHYDIAIDAQGLFRSGLLTWLTAAPRRLGLADAREGAAFAYTERVMVPAHAVHTVDRTLHLVTALGHEPVRDMRLYVGPDDQAWLEGALTEHQLTADQYVCVAPTTRWRSKCWPLERYSTLIRRLLTEAGVERVVILAGPDERDQVQTMLHNLAQNRRKGDAPVADRVVAPPTTVGQMMALLSRCRLLIANDSAALHVAVGLDRPVVGIFGPTDPATVGPYRRDDSVIQPPNLDAQQLASYRRENDNALIRSITVETVWAHTLSHLHHNPA